MHKLTFCLVTHRGNLSLEDFFAIILRSIDGGVNLVQLREKMRSTEEICEVGKKLHNLLKPLGVPLIINDRVDIASEIGAEGVHLGQSDLKVSNAREILGKEAIIGLSVETIDQVVESEEDDVNYLAASPVFVTNTKLDCAPPWGVEGLKSACQISRHPVFAIGGINETNVEQVLKCGARGIAVVSPIFNAPCPKKAAIAITNKMRLYADSRLG